MKNDKCGVCDWPASHGVHVIVANRVYSVSLCDECKKTDRYLDFLPFAIAGKPDAKEAVRE